ncbi:hypothetical protein ACFL0T_08465 [Candidatus Omnitrophota bacterium]
MKKIYNIIFICAVFLMIQAPSAISEEDSPEILSSSIESIVKIKKVDAEDQKINLGTLINISPEIYAVIKDLESDKTFLYAEGDFLQDEFEIMGVFDNFVVLKDPSSEEKLKNHFCLIKNIPYMNMEFVELANLDTLEYFYRPIDQRLTKEEDNFKLVNIQGNKAVLERNFVSTYNKKFSTRPKKMSPDMLFFHQLRTKKIAEDTWEVDSQSVATALVGNVQDTVAYAAKRVKSVGFGTKGFKLSFQAQSCSGTLDKSGFLVDKLRPEIRHKAGLVEGDIIKTINGKKIYNLIDLMFVFLQIREGSSSNVNVNILRNGASKTLNYIVA